MNDNDDVIGSLGEVLSSVNLAGDEAAARGNNGAQQYGTAPGSWSGISCGSGGTAPSGGISYNFYSNGSNAQQPSNKSNPHESLQNVLYDSGIYEKEEVVHRRASTGAVPVPAGSRLIHSSSTGTPPPASSDRERKPSIDIFLSQSPSKALGDDAFRVMTRTSSNPALVKMNSTMPGQAHIGKPPGLASTAPSSRSESPLTARSSGLSGAPMGTSPYGSNHGRQQQQMGYAPQYNNVPSNNFSGSPIYGNVQGQLHTQLQQHTAVQQQTAVLNQFPTSGNIQGLSVNNSAPQQQVVQQQQPAQQFVPVQQVQQAQQQQVQQPQVFYMAVPGPDGKQVLQPVQMVQMPGGQAGTIMMPVQQQQQAQPTTQQANQGLLLPSALQGNTGMGNGLLYGQNNGVGNAVGNQYSPYGGVGGAYDRAPTDPTQQMGVAGLYSSPQRPPLRALLGNVRRLSRDQVGCRLLQQALDEDGPDAATAILSEGLTFWAEAMVDPFGNYLFQKILERITPDERITLVSSVSTRLVNASLNLHGTRSVQKIVEVCAIDEEEREDEEEKNKEKEIEEDDDEADKKNRKKKTKDSAAKILTDALKPSAARLCIDSHGNHAIQRILLKLPYQHAQFIFDAVAASVEDVARHRHGCCVIQRCLDSRHSAARSHLVGRIVEKSLELMQDAYGNYVVQYVLDVCGDDEVHAICESVVGKVCLLAVQKFSSNVMEKCLERCTDRVREEYLDELNDSDRLRELMMDPFGNYVVQRALSVSTHAQAIRLVETMKPHLSSANGGGIRNTAGGRRILGKICRRFPNFQLEGETFEDYDLNQVLARSGHHASPHGGRRHHSGQFGGRDSFGYQQPGGGGPSPGHYRGRGGRYRTYNNTIPGYQPHNGGYQQQHQALQVNVQPDMTQMQPQPGGNVYGAQVGGAGPYNMYGAGGM